MKATIAILALALIGVVSFAFYDHFAMANRASQAISQAAQVSMQYERQKTISATLIECINETEEAYAKSKKFVSPGGCANSRLSK